VRAWTFPAVGATGPSKHCSIVLSRSITRRWLSFSQIKTLPAYVRREFENYLRCGRLEHGFLRVRCESCHIENLGPSAASAVGSARAAAHGAWWRARRCWRTTSAPREPAPVGTECAVPVAFSVCHPPANHGRTLGVVTRAIAAYLVRKAGMGRNTESKETGWSGDEDNGARISRGQRGERSFSSRGLEKRGCLFFLYLGRMGGMEGMM